MHQHHPDMTSSVRHGWRFFSRLACVLAVALMTGAVNPGPEHLSDAPVTERTSS